MKTVEPLSSILVKYGPREEQIIKEIKNISEKTLIPDNKNEILRRGLHAVRFLAEVDEEFLLSLLSQLLHICASSYDMKNLKIAKELAFTIHAIQIIKYGVLRAETFDSISKELQLMGQLIENEKPKQMEIEEEFKKTMKKLANSVDTIFRKSGESSIPMLFPVIFLEESRLSKIMKPHITAKLDYEDLNDTKKDFLAYALAFAVGKNVADINKIRKEMAV